MSALKLTVKFSKEVKINIFKRYASSGKIRVRFAPSPTGFLHLGGLRTALYNHLFAKSQNGVTILRIEDTDQSRKVEFATENIVEDLAWCGITYDEGPYLQSERKEIYQKYVQQLIDQGDAYYCFCSNIRLELLRRESIKLGEVPRYDNTCRHWSKEEIDEKLKSNVPYCVRFKLSSSAEPYDDLVYGPTLHDVFAVEGDPVIFKKDGFPTYHLANVVDDHLMNISHVLRGAEWHSSTPKHLLLYKAFNWKPPAYAHLPLLLNPDGSKLSKRQGDAQIRALRESGIFPNAVINFIIRFGGGFHIEQKEKDLNSFTLQELIHKFDLSKIKGSSCSISIKHLNDYNQLEIKRLMESESGRNILVKRTQEIVKKNFLNSVHEKNLKFDDHRIKLILESTKNRISKLEDLVSKEFRFLWLREHNWYPQEETLVKALEKVCGELKNIQTDWNQEKLKKFLWTFMKENGLQASVFLKMLRTVLTGSEVGLSVAEIMELLGRDDVHFRLLNSLNQRDAGQHLS